MPVDIETEMEQLGRGEKLKEAATLVIEACSPGVPGSPATILRDQAEARERMGRDVER